MKTPRLYATFLLWMLAQLFDKLPEVGDPDKPKLVFFFDEAHLLFNEAPKALLDQVERVTRLIRSKGVGVYYVTQNPRDVPNSVSAQLGNRIQHALRAFTPIEQKGIRAAAETFRPNPGARRGARHPGAEGGRGAGLGAAQRRRALHGPAHADPPAVGPHRARSRRTERKSLIEASPLYGKYEETVDRDSAYEMLQKRVGEAAAAQEADANSWGSILMGAAEARAAARAMARRSPSRSSARWRAASAGPSPVPSSAGARSCVMTTRPDDRSPRMPSGTEEIQTAYGEPQRRSGGRPAPEHWRNGDQIADPLDRRHPRPRHHARHRRAALRAKERQGDSTPSR